MAVDKVRRDEHRQLMKDDDDRLSKTKYIWLTSFEKLSEKEQEVVDGTYDLQILRQPSLNPQHLHSQIDFSSCLRFSR